MKLLAGLLTASLLTTPFALLAQEPVAQKTYLLAKVGRPTLPKGQFKGFKQMSMADGKVQVEFGKQVLDGTLSTANQEEILYDFVSDDLIRVTYEKNRSLEKSVMMGQKSDKEKIAPSEGKVVLLEKKEGTWVGKLEKGEMKEDDQEKFDKTLQSLVDDFNEDEGAEMYGTEPREIGESWDVDPSLMPGMDEFKVEGGKLTLTFAEVKEFQGEPCAVLKVSFTVNAKMTEEKLAGADVTMKGSGRVVRSLALFTDYKFTGEMTMAMSGEIEAQPGVHAQMSMGGEMKVDIRLAKVEPSPEE